MEKNKALIGLATILLLASCSSVSRDPSSVYVSTGTNKQYAVPLNTVRTQFADGSIDVLSININVLSLNPFSREIEVKEWAGDKVYIDFAVTSENQNMQNSFTKLLDSELQKNIGKTGRILEFDVLSNFKNQCSRMDVFGRLSVQGVCLEGIKIWVPKGGSLTTVLINDRIASGKLVGKYTEELFLTDFDNAKIGPDKFDIIRKFKFNNGSLSKASTLVHILEVLPNHDDEIVKMLRNQLTYSNFTKLFLTARNSQEEEFLINKASTINEDHKFFDLDDFAKLIISSPSLTQIHTDLISHIKKSTSDIGYLTNALEKTKNNFKSDILVNAALNINEGKFMDADDLTKIIKVSSLSDQTILNLRRAVKKTSSDNSYLQNALSSVKDVREQELVVNSILANYTGEKFFDLDDFANILKKSKLSNTTEERLTNFVKKSYSDTSYLLRTLAEQNDPRKQELLVKAVLLNHIEEGFFDLDDFANILKKSKLSNATEERLTNFVKKTYSDTSYLLRTIAEQNDPRKQELLVKAALRNHIGEKFFDLDDFSKILQISSLSSKTRDELMNFVKKSYSDTSYLINSLSSQNDLNKQELLIKAVLANHVNAKFIDTYDVLSIMKVLKKTPIETIRIFAPYISNINRISDLKDSLNTQEEKDAFDKIFTN